MGLRAVPAAVRASGSGERASRPGRPDSRRWPCLPRHRDWGPAWPLAPLGLGPALGSLPAEPWSGASSLQTLWSKPPASGCPAGDAHACVSLSPRFTYRRENGLLGGRTFEAPSRFPGTTPRGAPGPGWACPGTHVEGRAPPAWLFSTGRGRRARVPNSVLRGVFWDHPWVPA